MRQLSIKNRAKRAVYRVFFSLGLIFIAQCPVFADGGVSLAWNPIVGADVAGYVLHSGPASRTYSNTVFIGNVTNATIPNLIGGTTNYFMVTTLSVAGLESAPSEEVSYVVPASLIVVTNGNGVVSPNLTSAKMLLGKQYSLTAVPAAGQLFAGWSGGMASMTPKITFSIKSNLMLQASFVTNPFIATQGSYNGLFYEADAIRQTSAGFFTMTVTARGAYSGRIQIGAGYSAFSGKLDLHCAATNVILRSITNALTLELQIGTGNSSNQISGRITDGNWTATILANRTVFNSRLNPAPYAGNYTMTLPGFDNDPNLPAGDGYGTVRVDAGGVAHFIDNLADGTKAVRNVPLAQNGLCPLYVSLYSGNGSIVAWLTFANQPTSDLSGRLSWIKPPVPAAAIYPVGFTTEIIAAGSLYQPPATNTDEVMNFSNASLAFSGGNLATNFTSTVFLLPSGAVTNLSGGQFKMNVALGSGIFTGSTKDPASGKALSFHGVVLQKMNFGSGFLLGTNQSSRVVLSP